MNEYESLFGYRKDLPDPYAHAEHMTLKQLRQVHESEMLRMDCEHKRKMEWLRATHPGFRPWWRRILGL